MRIISGELRGKIIEAPEGEGTRPTIDRVKESLFSSLYSLGQDFSGAVVLDAFAGSGSLGIEALSRGAKKVVFYEQDPVAAKVVERNLKNCRMDATRAQLRKVNVLESAPVSVRPAFDVVFLDPPYAMDPQTVADLVLRLDAASALSADAIICYEHASKDRSSAFEDALGDGWFQRSSKKYGKIAVDLYERDE